MMFLFGPVEISQPFMEDSSAVLQEIWDKAEFDTELEAYEYLLEKRYPGYVCFTTSKALSIVERLVTVATIVCEGD